MGKRISELSTAPALSDSDYYEVMIGGVNYKVSGATLRDYASPLKLAVVTLNTSNILNLFTTPQQIAPAPGAGKFIEVVAFSLKSIFNSIAFAGAGASDLWLNYGPATASLHNTAMRVDHAFSAYTKLNMDLQAEWAPSVRENTSITISSHSSNPTTGNGSAKCFLIYQILTF